jgi:hypothetical protein
LIDLEVREPQSSDTYVEQPTESYAAPFAFMSLIAPDRAVRDDYGRRAPGPPFQPAWYGSGQDYDVRREVA